MNQHSPRSSSARISMLTAASCAIAVTVTACAGGIATRSPNSAGAGVGPRADFSAYTDALSSIEPITLTYQPSAQSADAIDAYRDHEFKQNVEEASGGKISIDIVYAQGIAGYSELPDALADGRVDIAYTLSLYDPTRFPVHSALVAGTTLTGASPRAEELAANAAMLEVAWNTPELIDELETAGLVPLIPFNADGTPFALCGDSGGAEDDWHGRQIRVSSAPQESQLAAMGASPVSLEYTETFEALQRKVIDCTLSAALPANNMGFMEVAPHLSYSEDVSFARGSGAIVAGQSFNNLPLAAQQLIYDQMAEVFMHSRRSDINSNILTAEVVREQGGGFKHLDDATEEALVEVSSGLTEEYIAAGVVSEGFGTRINEALEKWRGVVDEMELGDEGTFDDVDTWHDDESVNLMPFAERVYAEVMEEHRPQ